MAGDLITALTVLCSIGLAGGILIVCLLATHAHGERMAGTRRLEQDARTAEARQLRGVR